MELTLYQVDAFASRPFEGNPAAVCPLQEWLPDAVLQAIALENNLSETAFFVPQEGGYRLRWFTPTVEVDLCGHATLASAWVLFHELGEPVDELRFATRSGELRVSRAGNALAMDFPASPPRPSPAPDGLLQGLGLARADVLAADDYIVVVDHEDIVAGLAPDFARLRGLPKRGVAVTAPGREVDFVSRWFGPNVGIDEDPVTGSAHTSLAPYWADRLDKSSLVARQGGRRRGELGCQVAGERVVLTGHAVTYLTGRIRF